MRVLNVGGGTNRTLPDEFSTWTQDVLDIDPAVNPDIVCDALELKTLPPSTYDAVWCAHNLEHFYHFQVETVLEGFLHVLNEDGFAQIVVPNLLHVFEAMAVNHLDIHDTWYRANSHPVTFHDVLFGWNYALRSGNCYYAHKCGFSKLSLLEALHAAGFGSVFVGESGPDLIAKAYRKAGVPCP
jgi:hypothetical protein